MGRLLMMLVSTCLLTACVTEQTFIDSKKQVRNLEFDKSEASKTRLILGLSYLENGRYEQAKFNLEKAYEFTPKRADVNYSLGYYYQLVGEMDIAEKYFKKAVELEPKNPDTLNNYGTFLCNLGQVEKAESYFKRAISISKYTRSAESYENMAICALNNDQFAKAERYYETSYKHNPSRANNVLSLAGVKYASGDLVSALDFYGRYLRLNSVSPRGLLLGYIIESKRGRLSQANKYANQLRVTFGNSREALYLSTGKVAMSEFEALRLKIRNHSVNSENGAPQIRIVKKPENKRSRRVNESSSLAQTGMIGAGALSEATRTAKTTAQLSAELKKKVAMFAAPLTDSETIEFSSKVETHKALPVDDPLPQEQVKMNEIEVQNLVNDRAEAEGNRTFLEIDNDPLVVPTYVVEEGDNLYRVSVRFNVQIASLMKWNQLKKEELVSGQILFVANPVTQLTVASDVRLSQLAKQQKVTLSALMRWNKVESDGWVNRGVVVNLVDPQRYQTMVDMINQTGQRIPVLTPAQKAVALPMHLVKENEFLYNISTKYNIKISALIKWNDLASETDIQVGQRLFLTNPDIYYHVKQQQKLSDVANQLNIALSDLMAWNNLAEDGVLLVGTRLLKVNAERYQ